MSLTRIAVLSMSITLAACGGGGGGSTDSPGNVSPTPDYSKVQPPTAPAAELVDLTKATGVVSVSSDTFDPAGHQAGTVVELHVILPDGTLGAAQATAITSSDGGFSIAMPVGTSASAGGWMLLARKGTETLRAYVYSGAMRVDASSETWVRLVLVTTGKLPVFSGSAMATLKAINRSLALFSDSTGADHAGQTLEQSVEAMVVALKADHAMRYTLATLGSTGALPATGTGDIGTFFAVSETYAGQFTDTSGAAVYATQRSPISPVPVPADGSWTFRQQLSSMVNGQWTPIVGAGSDARVAPNGWFTRLTGSGSAVIYLGNAVGEYPEQSFPVQPGSRQLDGRRITKTQLNFSGGKDEQPMAFASTETVEGVETLTLAAGTFRAVRVVHETQLVLPNADGSTRQISLRATLWLVPGAGIVKETEESFVDGAAPAGSSPSTLELSVAYANSAVWPSHVTMTNDYQAAIAGTRYCSARIPGTRRLLTLESGVPIINGTPRLALGVWDVDTAQQVVPTRTFSGNLSSCPVVEETSGAVWVVETFGERNSLFTWPAGQASARAYSDVVHQISASDLSDVATYRIEPVPDEVQVALYHPASVASLVPAPDGGGRFVVGSVRSSQTGSLGNAPQFVQVLGPGLNGLIASVGKVLIPGVDWASKQIFTNQNFPPFTLAAVTFDANGASFSAARFIATNTFIPALWYISPTYLHFGDGTVRVGDGNTGPRLPIGSESCRQGHGVLVCLDRLNDRLVKLDPDTLATIGTAPLGSFLRSLAAVGPDFRAQIYSYGEFSVLDASTFVISGKDVHVEKWR